MIYYNDELIEWKKPTTDLGKEINAQIKEVEKKFFGENAKGVAVILWDEGKRVKNPTGYWEVKRPFPVELLSSDGLTRYSPTRGVPSKDKTVNFTTHHIMIKDQMAFTASDIEFLWFLSYHCDQFAKGRLKFEDTASDASKAVDKMAEDTELRFYLMGKTSPLAKDEVSLKSIASAFGIEKINTLSLDEIKLAIYEAVQRGNKSKDTSCNYDTFIEYTQAPKKHKIASRVREAIRAKDLHFDKEKFAWFLKGDDNSFLQLKGTEVQSKDSILITTVVNSPRHTDWLLKYYGEGSTLTADEIRAMKRPDLNSTAKMNGLEFSNSDKNAEIAEKLIVHLGLS